MTTDNHLSPIERLIFPLDVPDWKRAAELAHILGDKVGWFKVGLELFTAEGPSILGRLRDIAPKTRLFLDLKLHDIPATVGRAMGSVSRLGADLVTVHAQGGLEMLKAAVASAGQTKVLAVTVLTSLDPADLSELAPDFKKPGAFVKHLAQRAMTAGCHGLVASAQEAASLRNSLGPEPLLIIPGIRPQWSQINQDDQKRVGTPAQALADGASLLVIGRPIRDAENPATAADKVLAEIAQALS